MNTEYPTSTAATRQVPASQPCAVRKLSRVLKAGRSKASDGDICQRALIVCDGQHSVPGMHIHPSASAHAHPRTNLTMSSCRGNSGSAWHLSSVHRLHTDGRGKRPAGRTNSLPERRRASEGVGDIIVRMPVVFSLSSRFSRGRSSAPLLRTTIVLFLVVDQGLMLLWFYGVWSSEFAVQSTSRVEYTEMEDRIVAAPMTVWLAWTERFCDACSRCRYGIPDDTSDTPSKFCRTVSFGEFT